jgi:signal transduction histidine kinase
MPRGKEIGYCIVRFPTGMAFGLGVTMLWAGSLALAALPATIRLMPDDRAEFWLFTVGDLPTALLVALVGLVGLVFVAPWSTLAVGRLDVAFASWFLGPNRQAQLAAEARTAEAGRAAALGSAETERRRIERDLHDGAQQRLVALAMDLGAARERLDSDPEIGKRLVAKAHDEAKEALREIRDLVRGIHPVILEDRGLDAALSAIVARSPIPVDLDITIGERPPATVESAAYFVVSEALTNVARHSDATRARVAIARRGDRLLVEVSDDGRGGADPSQGTGLAGLAERAAAMGGTMDVLSPTGGPTTLLVELPCAS